MKQSKLIVIIFILLIIGGWSVSLLGNGNDDIEQYNQHIELAEKYMGRELYQKAIQEYQEAIALENKQEDWDAMFTAYAKRYEESKKIHNDYLQAAKNAVALYPQNPDYLITLVELYKIDEDYVTAYKALKKSVEAGMKDEKVQSLLKEVKYAFKEDWVTYSNYRLENNGYYAVDANGTWTYIKEDGGEVQLAELVMAGSVGDAGISVIFDGNQGQLIDMDEIVQGKLKFVPENAGIYSEGLVPISDGKSYSYYDSFGDKQFGEYQEAGSFANGEAAVKVDGKWYLIDAQGKRIEDAVYEDIILHANLSHKKNGVMIAKKGGSYQIYKEDGILEEKFEQADIVTDDGIVAVCQKGKWGFINLEGEWIVKPSYSEAKSFSNGLAAVSNGEKWGFINLEGELVIDYLFNKADYFNSQGSCMVETTVEKIEEISEESTEVTTEDIRKETWKLIILYVKD